MAEKFGGTPFDEKYMKMSDEQLMILGNEAIRSLKEKQDEKYETIRLVAQATQKYLSKEFEFLRYFVNPKTFQEIQKQIDMKKYEEELKPEDVPVEFAKLEEMGLDELEVVEEEKPREEPVPLAEEIVDALGAKGFEEFAASFLTAQASLADIDLEEE